MHLTYLALCLLDRGPQTSVCWSSLAMQNLRPHRISWIGVCILTRCPGKLWAHCKLRSASREPIVKWNNDVRDEAAETDVLDVLICHEVIPTRTCGFSWMKECYDLWLTQIVLVMPKPKPDEDIKRKKKVQTNIPYKHRHIKILQQILAKSIQHMKSMIHLAKWGLSSVQCWCKFENQPVGLAHPFNMK